MASRPAAVKGCRATTFEPNVRPWAGIRIVRSTPRSETNPDVVPVVKRRLRAPRDTIDLGGERVRANMHAVGMPASVCLCACLSVYMFFSVPDCVCVCVRLRLCVCVCEVVSVAAHCAVDVDCV